MRQSIWKNSGLILKEYDESACSPLLGALQAHDCLWGSHVGVAVGSGRVCAVALCCAKALQWGLGGHRLRAFVAANARRRVHRISVAVRWRCRGHGAAPRPRRTTHMGTATDCEGVVSRPAPSGVPPLCPSPCTGAGAECKKGGLGAPNPPPPLPRVSGLWPGLRSPLLRALVARGPVQSPFHTPGDRAPILRGSSLEVQGPPGARVPNGSSPDPRRPTPRGTADPRSSQTGQVIRGLR